MEIKIGKWFFFSLFLSFHRKTNRFKNIFLSSCLARCRLLNVLIFHCIGKKSYYFSFLYVATIRIAYYI